MNTNDADALSFAAATFRSVWALEVLLALKREQRTWTRSELLQSLRASELVVARALDALVAGGLVSFDEDGVAYLPVSPDVGGLVDRVERLYLSRPNEVRRAIVAAGTSSATAFADAFRLRRGKDD